MPYKSIDSDSSIRVRSSLLASDCCPFAMMILFTVYKLRELHLLSILNWFEVGLALGLDKDGLDVIQIDNIDDVMGQRREMFDLWLRCGEVTGEVLVKALVDTSNIEAALKLCDTKGI